MINSRKEGNLSYTPAPLYGQMQALQWGKALCLQGPGMKVEVAMRKELWGTNCKLPLRLDLEVRLGSWRHWATMWHVAEQWSSRVRGDIDRPWNNGRREETGKTWCREKSQLRERDLQRITHRQGEWDSQELSQLWLGRGSSSMMSSLSNTEKSRRWADLIKEKC